MEDLVSTRNGGSDAQEFSNAASPQLAHRPPWPAAVRAAAESMNIASQLAPQSRSALRPSVNAVVGRAGSYVDPRDAETIPRFHVADRPRHGGHHGDDHHEVTRPAERVRRFIATSIASGR